MQASIWYEQDWWKTYTYLVTSLKEILRNQLSLSVYFFFPIMLLYFKLWYKDRLLSIWLLSTPKCFEYKRKKLVLNIFLSFFQIWYFDFKHYWIFLLVLWHTYFVHTHIFLKVCLYLVYSYGCRFPEYMEINETKLLPSFLTLPSLSHRCFHCKTVLHAESIF